MRWPELLHARIVQLDMHVLLRDKSNARVGNGQMLVMPRAPPVLLDTSVLLQGKSNVGVGNMHWLGRPFVPTVPPEHLPHPPLRHPMHLVCRATVATPKKVHPRVQHVEMDMRVKMEY